MKYYKVNNEFLTSINEETESIVISDSNVDKIYEIDGFAFEIVKLINMNKTYEEIFNELEKNYEGTQLQIKEELQNVIDNLYQINFLVK